MSYSLSSAPLRHTLYGAALLLCTALAACERPMVVTVPAAVQVAVPGPPGPAGSQGSQGYQGNTGNTGSTGSTGNTGNTGSQGEAGQTGQDGQTGQTGQTGRTGKSGDGTTVIVMPPASAPNR